MTKSDHFIVFPKTGFLGKTESGDDARMRALPHVAKGGEGRDAHLEIDGKRHAVTVVDSVSPSGPKLVRMDSLAGASFSGKDVPGAYRIYDVRHYHTANVGSHTVEPDVHIHTGKADSEIEMIPFTVTDAKSGDPVAGARLLAYTDYAASQGSPPATTDAQGQAQVYWLKSIPVIETLLVFPPINPNYWGRLDGNVNVESQLTISLEPVDPAYKDCVRELFPNPVFDPQVGVVVGVVDTGVAEHTGLNLVGGMNTVQGEEESDYGSNGDPHGTHVAGLVGAFGKQMQGTAPRVQIRSYRVFGENVANATSFDIVKGIYAGVNDKCDVLNLSLGVDQNDSVLKEAINHARDAGTLVIAAGDNDYGGSVGFPAAYPTCIGVSAIGRIDTIPEGAEPTVDISEQLGSDPQNFLAAFTSVGPEINYTGPGVGAISTVLDNTYGQMSGTSMACPVVSGCMASLLAQNQPVFMAARDRARSDKMADLLSESAESLGFTQEQQGAGLPGVVLKKS